MSMHILMSENPYSRYGNVKGKNSNPNLLYLLLQKVVVILYEKL